jgi:hypothetical protein
MSWTRFLKSKNIKFYATYFLLCLLIPFLALELALKFVTFPSGTGAGSASQRWFEKNWKPVTADGYRDLELDIRSNKPTMIFLGDSFTAGHGVKFMETYYFFLRENFSGAFNFVNLGKNGASTKHQEKNLDKFFAAYEIKPNYLIHQYFGNDIEDYTEKVKIDRSFLRRAFARVSEVFNYIDIYFYTAEFSAKYFDQLMSAYENQDVFEKHFADLKSVHEKVYAKNGQVILIAFPFLNTEETLKFSQVYIQKIKESFLQSCRKGDIFMDITPLASTLHVNERVVNFMDGHPSPKLHRIVGQQLAAIINDATGPSSSVGVAHCIK